MDYGLSHDGSEGEEKQRSKKCGIKSGLPLFTTPFDSR